MSQYMRMCSISMPQCMRMNFHVSAHACVFPCLSACVFPRTQSPPSINGTKLSRAKDVCAHLCKVLDTNPSVRCYYEPCGGMLAVLCKMVDTCADRLDAFIVADIDPHLVALWQHVRDHGLTDLPDVADFTKDEYVRCAKVAKDINSTGRAKVAYYGFAATRDGIRFNNWEKSTEQRAEKVRRFRTGLMYLRKYLLHKKVTIIPYSQNVFCMPVPTTPTLFYVDPPYYYNNFDRNPYFKSWKENEMIKQMFWMRLRALSDAGNKGRQKKTTQTTQNPT